MVYLISDGIYTKIGKSKDPLKRIKHLQIGCGRQLIFTYIFDVPDEIEKKLHLMFKKYRTESANEWFNLNSVNIEERFKGTSVVKLWDTSMGAFKAKQLNILLLKGNSNNLERKKIDNNLIGHKKEAQIRSKKMINDIKNHLKNNKNKYISYSTYISKYGFTKDQIKLYVKLYNLSYQVANHNRAIK